MKQSFFEKKNLLFKKDHIIKIENVISLNKILNQLKSKAIHLETYFEKFKVIHFYYKQVKPYIFYKSNILC